MQSEDNIILLIVSVLMGFAYIKEIVSLIVVSRFTRLAYKDGARSNSGLVNFVRSDKAGEGAYLFFSGIKILKEYGKDPSVFLYPPGVLTLYLVFGLLLESNPSEIFFWASIISFILAFIFYFRAKKRLKDLGFIGVLKM